jgi:hypothetical protein
MGKAIPTQQPAVVLRSNFNQLRALLAVALIAVAGLTVAVLILATDNDTGTGAGSATVSGPAGATRSDGGFRPGSETEFRGSKASEDGTSRFARPGSQTDLHGPASALP